MEDSESYRTPDPETKATLHENPEIAGALAALARASDKVIARDRAAGLEPVARKPDEDQGQR